MPRTEKPHAADGPDRRGGGRPPPRPCSAEDYRQASSTRPTARRSDSARSSSRSCSWRGPRPRRAAPTSGRSTWPTGSPRTSAAGRPVTGASTSPPTSPTPPCASAFTLLLGQLPRQPARERRQVQRAGDADPRRPPPRRRLGRALGRRPRRRPGPRRITARLRAVLPLAPPPARAAAPASASGWRWSAGSPPTSAAPSRPRGRPASAAGSSSASPRRSGPGPLPS